MGRNEGMERSKSKDIMGVIAISTKPVSTRLEGETYGKIELIGRSHVLVRRLGMATVTASIIFDGLI